MNDLGRNLPAAADLYGDLLEVAPNATRNWRDYWPGLVITVVAALAAAYLSEHYGAPLMLMGLLIGLAFNFANSDRRLHAGLSFASTTLLRWGIVLVGLQVTFAQIVGLGWEVFAAIAIMLVLVTLTGTWIARITGMGSAFGTLAGGAVAICGASAALALASVLGEKRATQAQLTLVLVSISAASALAMSIYPVLAAIFGLSDTEAGFLMGAAIHDVAQALGAGYSHSELAGQNASIVKLTRVALLAPTLAAVAWAYRRGGSGVGRIGVPWFVWGFLAMTALNSSVALPEKLLDLAPTAASALLLLAVTATGIRSPMQLLLEQGWRSSLPVVAATLASLGLALAAIAILR
ncbi:MAG: YeiH family protein [Sphingomonadaceae bacterium]